MLFHITSAAAWAEAQAQGTYRPASLATEGFIHLSEARQWPLAANRFFRGQTGLLLLSISEKAVLAPLRREAADGDLYPHLYGGLNLDAVVAVRALAPEADGSFSAES